MPTQTRIALFYDGTYLTKVSAYYRYNHAARAHLSFRGLHAYIRALVAECEGTKPEHVAMVEAHFFRGRMNAFEASRQSERQLYNDRLFDHELAAQGVTAHYLPIAHLESGAKTEKGVDVLLALEAFELTLLKKFDVVVLVTTDGDFVPLVRKLNGLGARTMLLGWAFQSVTEEGLLRRTQPSAALEAQVSYAIRMGVRLQKDLLGEPPMSELALGIWARKREELGAALRLPWALSSEVILDGSVEAGVGDEIGTEDGPEAAEREDHQIATTSTASENENGEAIELVEVIVEEDQTAVDFGETLEEDTAHSPFALLDEPEAQPEMEPEAALVESAPEESPVTAQTVEPDLKHEANSVQQPQSQEPPAHQSKAPKTNDLESENDNQNEDDAAQDQRGGLKIVGKIDLGSHVGFYGSQRSVKAMLQDDSEDESDLDDELPRHQGTIKWTRTDLSYGFITSEAYDKDIFFHETELPRSRAFYSVKWGEKVSFIVGSNTRGGLVAKRIQFDLEDAALVKA